jgi:hypothetical protein
VGIARRWGRICFFLALTAAGETIRYSTLLNSVIERRLAAVRFTNIDRERTLSDLFTEAGCSGDHLNEQPVKGSKVPNLICIMPGEMESVIVAGGHVDFVNEGQGVVDNWSGAALLPSLYQSLKVFAEGTLSFSSALPTRKREWLDPGIMSAS